MTSRSDNVTKAAQLDVRLKLWRAAVDSEGKYITYGGTLQRQGTDILKRLQQQAFEPVEALSMASQAGAIIDRGIAIERAARDKLIDLHMRKPKGK